MLVLEVLLIVLVVMLPVFGALKENDVELGAALVASVLAVPNENADLDVVLLESIGLPRAETGVVEADCLNKGVGVAEFSFLSSNFEKENPPDALSVLSAVITAVGSIGLGTPKLKDGFVLLSAMGFVAGAPNVKEGAPLLSVFSTEGFVKVNEDLESAGSFAASGLPNENNDFCCEGFEDAPKANEGILEPEGADESSWAGLEKENVDFVVVSSGNAWLSAGLPPNENNGLSAEFEVRPLSGSFPDLLKENAGLALASEALSLVD